MRKKGPTPPDGKKFYGSVTVSERGQIVVPAEARKDFNISAGDKLLVLGDLGQGIALVTIEHIQKMMSDSAIFSQLMQIEMNGSGDSGK